MANSLLGFKMTFSGANIEGPVQKLFVFKKIVTENALGSKN